MFKLPVVVNDSSFFLSKYWIAFLMIDILNQRNAWCLSYVIKEEEKIREYKNVRCLPIKKGDFSIQD